VPHSAGQLVRERVTELGKARILSERQQRWGRPKIKAA